MNYLVDSKYGKFQTNAPAIGAIGNPALISAARWIAATFGGDIIKWAWNYTIGSSKYESKLANKNIYSFGKVRVETSGSDNYLPIKNGDLVGIATGNVKKVTGNYMYFEVVLNNTWTIQASWANWAGKTYAKGSKQWLYAEDLMLEDTKVVIDNNKNFPLREGALASNPELIRLRSALVMKGWGQAPHYVSLSNNWGSGFTKNLQDADLPTIFLDKASLDRAIASIKQYSPNNPNPEPDPKPDPDPKEEKSTDYTPWIIGGVVLLKLLGKKGKKKGGFF